FFLISAPTQHHRPEIHQPKVPRIRGEKPSNDGSRLIQLSHYVECDSLLCESLHVVGRVLKELLEAHERAFMPPQSQVADSLEQSRVTVVGLQCQCPVK